MTAALHCVSSVEGMGWSEEAWGCRVRGGPGGALRLLERSHHPLLEHVIFFVGDQ